MNIKLREYQERALARSRGEFKEGNLRQLIVAPPGAGKGTLLAYMAISAAQKGNPVLISVHKRDLIIGPNSLAERFQKQFGFTDFGFYLSGVKQKERPIMMGTVQTMIRRKTRKFPMVIVDEAHRLKMDSYMSLMERFEKSILLGFTATPFRSDKKGFNDIFDTLIQVTTYNRLVKEKALVPTKVIAPKISPNLDGVHTRAGDYVQEELFKKFDEERIYNGVVDKWIEYANGKKTIVFNTNSKIHSRKTCDHFRARGIQAEVIDSDTSNEERLRLLHDFDNGKFEVLCNIGLFTEGISIDDVDCIVFNVATKSKTKWVQAAARGSRPVWNKDYSDWAKGPMGECLKTHCLILDFGGNCKRHGYVDDYDAIPFTLDPTPPKMREAPTKECPKCDFMVHSSVMVCPECGHIFESKQKKIYSDEAAWEEVARMETMVEQLRSKPYDKLIEGLSREPAPHMLRIIGKVRGFKPAWAAHMAYNLGYTARDPKKGFHVIGQILNLLKDHEIANGLEGVYDLVEKHVDEQASENLRSSFWDQ